MMLIRTVQESDLESIYNLALQSGVGITTLPQNQDLLKQRIIKACDSFKKNPTEVGNEYYLFVLEDNENKQIVGISAIEAYTGYETPFYSYKVSLYTRMSVALKVRNDYQMLHLVNDHQGCSELCTLFLHPDYRKNKNGLLLSKARLLFIAQHRSRFASSIIAEFRGVSDECGSSPFWDSLGAHFFHLPFAEVDRLTLATDKQFIADLMPQQPIYVHLLPAEAQAVIGKAHPSSVAAMSILLKEGFKYHQYVDIFDAGPTLEAPLSEIKTIKRSQLMSVQDLSDEINSPPVFISNTVSNFRATLDCALLKPKDNTCIISKATANLLKIKKGDSVRIAPFFS